MQTSVLLGSSNMKKSIKVLVIKTIVLFTNSKRIESNIYPITNDQFKFTSIDVFNPEELLNKLRNDKNSNVSKT